MEGFGIDTRAIDIRSVATEDYHELSVMVGELLNEIMDRINEKAFDFDERATEKRARELVQRKKYWVFLAQPNDSGSAVGFVSLYESYALYAEGAFGTIPELYVRPGWRSKRIGKRLLNEASAFARSMGWQRLEVTTPPLPQFDDTLRFYQDNGFTLSGGRKLKLQIAD